MIYKKAVSFRTSLLAVCILAFVSTPLAARMNFCTDDTKECTTSKITNHAYVLVTGVIVKQLTEKGEDHCTELTKIHSGDMARGGGSDTFNLDIYSGCQYHIKFNTTAGCAGDKDGKISSKDQTKGKTHLALKGDCGTLKVVVKK